MELQGPKVRAIMSLALGGGAGGKDVYMARQQGRGRGEEHGWGGRWSWVI